MDTERTSLYPSLEPIAPSAVTTLTEDELNQRIDQAKHKDRIRYMTDKQYELNTKLDHYKKVRHNWIIARRILQGVGFATTATLGVATIAVAGSFAIPLLPIILTGGGIGTMSLFSILEKSVFKFREKSLRIKQCKIKEILDKLHFYFEKCREDNVITVKEIEAFDKIVKEAYNIQTKQSSQIEDDTAFLQELVSTLQALPGLRLKSMPESQLKSLMQRNSP